MNLRKWLPVGLLLLAFALRVYRLDAQDIWGDEAWSVTITQLGLRESLLADTSPPLYYLLLRATGHLWGQSVFGLRYLSVLCGFITVAIIGRIAITVRPQLRDYALFVAALSPFLIYHAQEARMYGPLLVGASASILAYLHLLQGSRDWRWWVLYAISSLAAIYSHFYAGSILVAQGVIALGYTLVHKRWAFFGRITLLWIAMAAAFVPYFLQHVNRWESQTDFRATEWTIGSLSNISQRTLLAFGAGTTLFSDQHTLAWIIVALAIIGAASLAIHNRWASTTLVVLVLGGFVTSWALTPFLPFFWERYLIGTLPAFLILVASSIQGVAYRNRWAAALVMAGVLAISLIPTWQYHTQPEFAKSGYGQAMRLIESRFQEGDIILLNGPLQASLFDYYRPKNIEGMMIDRNVLLDSATTDAFFTESIGSARRVWLVTSGNSAEFDPDKKAAGWLAQNGSFASHRDLPGVGLDLFVMQAPSEPQAKLAINLGNEILLTGYALESDQLIAGEAVILTLFWQAQQPLDNAYTVFTHILDANGQLIAQADRQPQGGSRPTNTWQPDETIRDSYAIVLPEPLPAGEYSIQIGLYLWPNLTRLANIETGADTTLIDTVSIFE